MTCAMRKDLYDVQERQMVDEKLAKKLDKFEEIIVGVSWRYAANPYVDREDLEQELWVNYLKLIEKLGGPMNLDERLLATSSFNKAASFYRYSRRRYEANLQEYHDEAVDLMMDQKTISESDYDRVINTSYETGYEVVLMKAVYEKYPINSKERKYILIRLVGEGILDEMFVDNPEDRKVIEDMPEKLVDSHIVFKLGYKSKSPGSFTVMKNRLKSEIEEFLLMYRDSIEI